MKKLFLSLALTAAMASSAFAAPANSDYYKDPQSTYNKDATNDIFNFANMVACYIKAMAPEQMIGRGPYLARVDANKCEESGQVSNSDTTASSRFEDSWVVTSIDSDGALNVKVYIAGSSDGETEYTQVAVKVRNGVAEAPPNGQWRVDFCSSGTQPSSSGLAACDRGLGFAEVDSNKVMAFQKNGRSGTGMATGLINFTATKTGTGLTRNQDSRSSSSVASRIAFNPTQYLIASSLNGGSETNSCVDPNRDNPNTLFSVWSNFLYDPVTGKKVVNGNQGFSIGTESRSGNSGFASYNGVYFWDDVPNSDRQPGKKVTGNGKTYTIGVANGFLEKVSRTRITLADMDGPEVKFNFWGNDVGGRNPTQNVYFELTRREFGTGRTLASNEWVSFVGRWNKTTASFDISAFQICGNNCSVTPLTTTQSFALSTLVGNLYKVNGFGGWQDGTGVNFNGQLVNGAGAAATNTSPVNREITRRVSPDASIGRLSCVDWNCPYLDGSNLQQVWRPSGYPFANGDVKSFQWDPTTGTPNYVRGDTLGVGGSVISNPVYAFQNATGDNATYEIRLYPSANLAQLRCSNDATKFCSPGDSNSTYSGDFYRWRTGASYTRNIFLKDDSNGGQIVNFDPPLSFTYSVPNTPPIGVDSRYAGKKILLQSPGQGQIWYPSRCISVATGKMIDCNSTDPTREWITEVYIPTVDGADGTVTLVDAAGAETSTKYLVKWANRGAILARQPLSVCSALTLPANNSSGLPTIADWQDPTNPNSPNYLGTTWVTPPSGTTPRVIHGVVQP